RSVDVFVRKVRHKLEAASPDWRYVHTHFGIGYRFDAEPAVDRIDAALTVERIDAMIGDEAAVTAPIGT
ncbi:MAG: winged helix-turn-helix domain-containing protein, partial [Solirubrobacterales bacterium]